MVDFLSQIFLVLLSEIVAELDLSVVIFEFMAVFDRLLEFFTGFCVIHSLEAFVQNVANIVDIALLDTLAEELQVSLVVLQGVLDQKFEEIFGQVHAVIEIREGNFRLDHPEFRQVFGGVRVFGSESGTEGVDVLHAAGVIFDAQLTGHGQEGGFLEKIFAVIHQCRLLFRFLFLLFNLCCLCIFLTFSLIFCLNLFSLLRI